MKVILMTVILTSIVAIQVEDAIPGLNLPVVSLFNEEHANTTFLQLSGKGGYNYIGCYTDDGSRDLFDGPKKYGYKPDTCAAACAKYRYFALQNGGWCVCGNAYATEPKYKKVADSQCGRSGLGGAWRNSVYSVGDKAESRKCYIAYCNAHQDLKNAFCGRKTCTNQWAKCQTHWATYGKNEPSRTYNPIDCISHNAESRKCYIGYCNAHQDLKNAFCGGKTCTNQWAKCQSHWATNGKNENRKNNPIDCISRIDKDAHESIFDLLTDIKKSIQNELVSETNTAKKRCTSDTQAKVVAKKKDFYYDLTGCAKGSECETGTEAQQNLAVAANNDLAVRNAEGEKLDGQFKALGKKIEAAKKTKKGFVKDQTDGDALHKKRMAKFQNAIQALNYLDTCLDAKTGKIACPTKKGTVLLSEEDKNAIGHFKVGKVMLLMLDQALGGVKEKKLVNTLKKLLASCIKSLEASKLLEVAAHKKWNVFMAGKIDAQEAALRALIKKKGEVANQITANNKKKKRPQN